MTGQSTTVRYKILLVLMVLGIASFVATMGYVWRDSRREAMAEIRQQNRFAFVGCVDRRDIRERLQVLYEAQLDLPLVNTPPFDDYRALLQQELDTLETKLDCRAYLKGNVE